MTINWWFAGPALVYIVPYWILCIILKWHDGEYDDSMLCCILCTCCRRHSKEDEEMEVEQEAAADAVGKREAGENEGMISVTMPTGLKVRRLD